MMWETIAVYMVIAMISVAGVAVGLIGVVLLFEWLFGDIFERRRKLRYKKDPSD